MKKKTLFLVMFVIACSGFSWNYLPIGGGGRISDVYSVPSSSQDIRYAITDVGGAYRWDSTNSKWVQMFNFIDYELSQQMSVEALAYTDNGQTVYIACGRNGAWRSTIYKSIDGGSNWTNLGNPTGSCIFNGQGARKYGGPRMVVDPNDSNRIYLATRYDGLLRGVYANEVWSWIKLGNLPEGLDGVGVVWVVADAQSGTPCQTLYAAVAGDGTGTYYGGVYKSTNAGSTWTKMNTNAPADSIAEFCLRAKLTYAGNTLYVTCGDTDATVGGVYRISTSTGTWTDITPDNDHTCVWCGLDKSGSGRLCVGIYGWGDRGLYLSDDYGASWTNINNSYTTSGNPAWWSDENLGRRTATINFLHGGLDDQNILFACTAGIWSTELYEKNGTPTSLCYAKCANGHEETVVNKIVCLPNGNVISAIADFRGFMSTNVASMPDSLLGGSTYLQTINSMTGVDFAENYPDKIVVVGGNNSDTNPLGAGAYSSDGGATWTDFSLPCTGAIYGNVAISCDGGTIVWAPVADSDYYSAAWYSTDNGQNWTRGSGSPWPVAESEWSNKRQLSADGADANYFYLMVRNSSGHGKFYQSSDKGVSWTLVKTWADIESVFDVKARYGVVNEVWVAIKGSGLYRSKDAGANWTTIGDFESCISVGFGRDWSGNDRRIFCYGKLSGESTYAMYRSDLDSNSDPGTWTDTSDPDEYFGNVTCMAGDRTANGRCFVGTGGRGVIKGSE